MNGHRETWSLKSRGFRLWLIHRYYTTTDRAPSTDGLTQALMTLEAGARHEGGMHPVFIRTGRLDGKLYLDLADPDWRAVEIDTDGWRLTPEPPVYFHRPRGLLALPPPVAGGSIAELRPFLNLATEEDFLLIIAWLLAALRPTGPFPVLAIAGEPGSAKSTLARLLRSIFDPNVSSLRSTPREECDCWIGATNAAVVAFDNLSSIPAWLSDCLCRIATGGGFSTRQLHTDADEMLFQATRPIIITAVGDVIARSDLADRAIMIELPTIADADAQDEEQLELSFERTRPAILGALLDAMVTGLRNRPEVKLDTKPRLADFTVWAGLRTGVHRKSRCGHGRLPRQRA